ncbi:MAG TPA: UpxY family transcription antiterminator [Terriglobales bacterium]|jgi:transcription antitermination factor NusG|nr:UpxY family transcription antiterminator [Terriglobales bacterium]
MGSAVGLQLENRERAGGGESEAPATAGTQTQWYAAYTRSRHEKVVAETLEKRTVEHFLPLYETVRTWKNGRFKVQLPLFPGYLFVHIALCDRLQVLQVPGVVRLVGFKGVPAALPQDEIEIMRNALRKGIEAEPHPYLRVGQRVRITSGPMEGLQGILLRRRGRPRVVVSVDLIMRSVALDIDAAQVEPVKMNLPARAAR